MDKYYYAVVCGKPVESVGNFVDYLQSLTKKFEAESTYNQALNNYEMQKAYYIYYSGQDLQEHIK